MSDKKRFLPQDPENPNKQEIALSLELTSRATKTADMAEKQKSIRNFPYPKIEKDLLETRESYKARRLQAAKDSFIGLLKLGEITLEEFGLNETEVQSANREEMRNIIKRTAKMLEGFFENELSSLKQSGYIKHPEKLFVVIDLKSEIILLDSRFIWERGDK